MPPAPPGLHTGTGVVGASSMTVEAEGPRLPVVGGGGGGGPGGDGSPSSNQNSHSREPISGSPRFPKGGQ
eukprot:2473225-Prorocentrum_lima.AAC.1